MVDEVSKSLGLGMDTPFWIDTLCLPSTIDRKSAASPPGDIPSQWQRPFSSSIRHYMISYVRSQEALTIIRTSLRKSRLWTLEEGSAAQKLLFYFSQRMVTLEDILADVEEHRSKGVVWPTQSWCLTNDQSEKMALHRFVEHLADYLQVLRGEFRDSPETAGLDKAKLKRILRLGYLANPIFRYFTEEHEFKGILSIQGPLVEIYGSPCYGDQRLPGSGHKLVDLVGRLTFVSSIALPGE